MNCCREIAKTTVPPGNRPAVPRDWSRGVPERYVAGADTGGHQEGRSEQVIHEISGLMGRGAMAEKILVVDDEQEIRNLLDHFLREKGYEVVLASDGNQALKLAAEENPQVIILDIKMPGLDGLEVCKLLKDKEQTRLIPIIVITGFEDNKMEALNRGADDFVNKPFDMAEIAVRVKSALRIRHLTDELERAVAYIEELQEDLANKK
jgi:two-component system alkaline phosphatase synthesis response regulator PhoP